MSLGSLCVWCWGVTGQPFSCQCTDHCGAVKCPVDLNPEEFYAYRAIPVPVFEQPKEGQHT